MFKLSNEFLLLHHNYVHIVKTYSINVVNYETIG